MIHMQQNHTQINTGEPFNAPLLEFDSLALILAVEAARTTLTDSGDKWQAYEAFKRALPAMPWEAYESAINGICQELGL